MTTTAPQAVRLWGRGQLTIPKGVRQALHLDEAETLTIFAVGRCLVLTPKRLLRASLAREVGRSMKAQGLTLQDLLKTLKAERRRYIRENYAG